MAVPSSKRRKLSHSPSPVEDDQASIASGSQVDDVEEDMSQDDGIEDADIGADDMDDEDDDEAESEDEEELQEKANKTKDNKTKPKSNKSQPSSLEASSAAYTGG
ncbi:hypothetical protein KCU67_g16268, partial [Aureobasidium melanogenum]